MICPICHFTETRVTHSREQVRRRECCRCLNRWNTFEISEFEMKKMKRVKKALEDLTEELRAA